METHRLYDTVLILDFGSQYTHLIARRIRELGVYSEIWSCTAPVSSWPFSPKGILLSGGPSSVYDKDAPHVDKAIFDLGIPVLGICYGQQEMTWQLGGQVERTNKRGYGQSVVHLVENVLDDPLLANVSSSVFDVWMSHGDHLTVLPDGFKHLGSADSAPFAFISCPEKRFYGMQFHPEVTHTPLGPLLLKNFIITICECQPNWTMTSFITTELERIRLRVGETAHVVGAVSGGVDSTVAAVLMHRAIGDRFHAILVDHGCMRLDEVTQVRERLNHHLGIDLHVVEASDRFFAVLQGIFDPEIKRQRIGNTFIQVFEEEAKRIGGETPVEYLLQGTLYPDVIESFSSHGGPSATIKTHHNVGGLLKTMTLKLIEPLRELFKDEVRALGSIMGIDDELLWRHPFPGPGLAIRILGEVTRDQVQLLQRAEAIYSEEIQKAGLYRAISQAFAVLLPVRTVGVMGDQRTYDQVVVLRAVQTTDFMTATWFPMPYDLLRILSSRVINEVKGINRVTYDISSKPPSTIEWE